MIAKKIHKAIGGLAFELMGAKFPVMHEDALSFGIGKSGKHGINFVKIQQVAEKPSMYMIYFYCVSRKGADLKAQCRFSLLREMKAIIQDKTGYEIV